MTTIQYTNDDFTINGVSSKNVVKTLKESGLKDSVIAEIVGGWFVGVTGASNPEPFTFVTDVESSDGKCTATYKRTFAHTDWVDGESRVQAGMTPEELGFNARFHTIESEFDAIALQFAALSQCAKGIRDDLYGVTQELEAKITALQNEIHERKQEDDKSTPPIIVGTGTYDDKEILITKFGDDIKFIDTGIKNIIKNPRGPVINPAGPTPDHVFGGSPVYDPETMNPNEVLELVKDLNVVFAQPKFQELFAGGGKVSVGTIRTKGSNVVLESGMPLGSVLATFPANTTFSSPADGVSMIIEHVVGDLPAETAKGVKTKVFGAGAAPSGAAVTKSAPTAVGIDNETSHVLVNAGYSTVGKLAAASPGEISGVLAAAGMDANAAGGILAAATVGKAMRNVGF